MAEHSCHWRRTADKQAEQLRVRQAEFEAQQAQLKEMAARVADLEHKLALATRQIVGPKSERMPTPEDELRRRESQPTQRGGYTNPAKRTENAQKKAALEAD